MRDECMRLLGSRADTSCDVAGWVRMGCEERLTMEIRKLETPGEWLESERVIECAFLHPYDEDEARRKIQAQAAGSLVRTEESWGLFSDEGSMVSSVSTLRHTLSFGGRDLSCAEVHMVGSLPEGRGAGGVRALMGEILRAFKARGDTLCILIPFSCSFYRKFGFELVQRLMRQRLAIDELAGFACDLKVTRVWEEGDLGAVRALWDGFARTHDLSELRADPAWRWRGNGDFGEPDFLHPERQCYTYVLWDGRGCPCAYVRFTFFHEPDCPFVGALDVTELVWTDPASLVATLGFLYRMRAKVSHVNFTLADLDLSVLVPEGDKVEQTTESHLMARMLDSGQLLRQMPQPAGVGSYVVEVRDDFLPEVSGRLRVTYREGVSLEVTPTDAGPDLVVDQRVACQLILGRISLQEALYHRSTQVLGNAETLHKVFVRRPIYLMG